MEPSETRPVRTGEEIDVGRLGGYLEAKGFAQAGDIAIEQFPAGSSNLTYLIKAGDEEFVLRRPPFGNTVKTAHDMRREFDVLSKLSVVYPQAPKPLVFCDDGSVTGSEFYLMERRRGLVIRGGISIPPSGVGGPTPGRVGRISSPTLTEGAHDNEAVDCLYTSQDYRESVCRGFIANLAELHSLDYEAAGLGDLGRPDGYCRRQVEGWTKRYLNAKTDEHAELESAIEWLSRNVPADSGASLVHNDYKFDNVMLDPSDLTRIVAVLDWEMVTVGDPLMDLGTTLGYWMSKEAGPEMLSMPFNPRILMENVSRRKLAEMYFNAIGIEPVNLLFYYVFGTVKIAVIAQQIYARYVTGFTRDGRFSRFDVFVGGLGRLASRAVETNRI